MAKTGIRIPTTVVGRIHTAIASLEKREFTVHDVLRIDPTLPRAQCSETLSRRVRKHALERVRRGVFIHGGIRMQTPLPKGLVADAVWAVLFTDTDRRAMRLGEITGEAELYINCPGTSLTKRVSTILCYWYRGGHLVRTGKYNEYAYRLKSGVTERPVARYCIA